MKQDWCKEDIELLVEWINENKNVQVPYKMGHKELNELFPTRKKKNIYEKWRRLRVALGMSSVIGKDITQETIKTKRSAFKFADKQPPVPIGGIDFAARINTYFNDILFQYTNEYVALKEKEHLNEIAALKKEISDLRTENERDKDLLIKRRKTREYARSIAAFKL